MKKNSLWKSREQIIRVLDVKNEKVFVIDCVKRTMPYWVIVDSLSGYEEYTESEMIQRTGAVIPDIEKLDAESRRFIREHFTMIAPVLPFVSDMKQRTYIINQIAAEKNVSKQTIRNYLCLYLVLWSSIFVTLMANKIGGLQFGIYRNCQISSRVFHTAVAALPLTKANRSDFE